MNSIVQDTTQDIRFALRQLRRSPFFTLTTLATVALSIGATAALSGVLRATLLHPLPYPQPNQLLEISDSNLKGFKASGLVACPRVQDLADLNVNGHKLFSQVAFFYSDASTLAETGQTSTPVPAAAVSGNFFTMAGTTPLLGRTIQPSDDVPNGPQVLVLSYRLWQTKFSGDPGIIGRTVRLGPDPATVIGVMPKDFALPTGIDLWHPGHVFPSMFAGYRGDGSRFADVIARLAPGETPATAAPLLQQLATHLAKQFPETDAAWGFHADALRDSLFGSVRQALFLLIAAVAMVLAVAAVNMAGLQLSRNTSRSSEFAIRSALGSSRARLIRQLITENLLLVLAGATAGIALAMGLLQIIATRLPATLLVLDAPKIDATALTISLAAALCVGLFTSILPALRTRNQRLGNASRSLTNRRDRAGKLFAIAQITVSLVLLTISASVLQGLYHLLTTPLGFDATNLTTFTVDLPWGADAVKAEQNRHLYAQLEDQFAAIPGVQSAASMNALPFSGFSGRTTYDIAGQPPTPNHDAIVAEGRNMSLGYLHTLHIPLLAGRTFTPQDAEPNSPDVVLINQTFAHRYFPTTNPIGQHLSSTAPTGKPFPLEIIGIIGDVHGTGGSLSAPIQPEIYTPVNGYWPHQQFAVRSNLPAATLERSVHQIVASSSSIAQVGKFSTISTQLEARLIQPRLNASLLTAFAALSLLLVTIGIYGLVAFEVAQRTREMGLRIALGSTRGGVLALLLKESSVILTAGLALGILCSLIASRILAATYFNAQTQPILLILATAPLLILAVLAATFIPARRASTIDPMTVLRSE
jgi:putative ABC transport system permease protein